VQWLSQVHIVESIAFLIEACYTYGGDTLSVFPQKFWGYGVVMVGPIDRLIRKRVNPKKSRKGSFVIVWDCPPSLLLGGRFISQMVAEQRRLANSL
jgi:hypothetical protein